MFSFNAQPRKPLPPPAIARKCIVCGTTKHERDMKPFLLKGDQLNVWTNYYFAHRRQKLFPFFAKLRYTINPYSCTDHFNHNGPDHPPEKPQLAKQGMRNVAQLVNDEEEPPSIQKIIEKKPSPPPEEPKEPRTEKEVTDAVMAILKTAKEEMDKEEKQRKVLRRITRKMNADCPADYETRAKRRKKKKKRREREAKEGEKKEKRVVDGNEADSDNSETIDVEGIDDSDGKSTSSGSSGSEESDSDDAGEVDASLHGKAGPPRIPGPPPRNLAHRTMPPPMVVVPRRFNPTTARPYLIYHPGHKSSPLMTSSMRDQKPTPFLVDGRSPQTLRMHPSRVPKRLTLANAGTGKTYMRPSWVGANPSQLTLASVLQRFWNEDNASVSDARPFRPINSAPRPPFGQTVLPGTSTKFKPAALAAPSLMSERPTSDPPVHHPSVRHSALMHNNPPLSPSRIIIGGEEEVRTSFPESEDDEKTLIMTSSSSSSSSSTSSSEDSDIEVCDHSASGRPPVQGAKIEGELEEKSVRSRTVSSVLSNSSEDLSEDDGSESEVDVETLDERSDDNEKEDEERMDTVDDERDTVEEERDMMAPPPGGPPADTPVEKDRWDRRKQRLPSSGSRLYHHALATRGRFILPPSALVKPPTRLLSSLQYSMRDLLHAQGRAAAGQPVRIDTTGLVYGAKKHAGLRPKGMPRLFRQTRGESEWARLERIVEQKMADHKAKKEAERRKQQLNLVDPQLMSENPPPELDRVETDDETDPGKKKEEGKEEEDGLPLEGHKVLRMTFKDKKEKKEEVDGRKLKVLDRSTRPLGVCREEVVEACEDEEKDDGVPPTSPPKMEQMAPKKEFRRRMKEMRKEKEEMFKKAGPQREVRNPLLIINKDEMMEIKERLNAPPPTPVVGIPNEEEFAARRVMFQKKRKSTLLRANLRFGELKKAKAEWKRMKMMDWRGMGAIRRGMRNVDLDEDEEGEEELKLMAVSARIVQIVKADKNKLMARKRKKEEGEKKEEEGEKKKVEEEKKKEEEAKEVEGAAEKAEKGGEEGVNDATRKEGAEENGEKKSEEEKENEKRDEDMPFMLSDIENDDENEKMEEEKEMEEEDDKEEEEEKVEEEEEKGEPEDKKKKDADWKMRGGARVKEEEGETRRKSHRLRVKRAALPKSERRLIWKDEDDEDDEEEEEVKPILVPPKPVPPKKATPKPAKPDQPAPEQQQQPAVVDGGKRKRGRPTLEQQQQRAMEVDGGKRKRGRPSLDQQQPVVDGDKPKRGRPRKNPLAAPPKEKRTRVAKLMTEEEKEVLSRVLAPIVKPTLTNRGMIRHAKWWEERKEEGKKKEEEDQSKEVGVTEKQATEHEGMGEDKEEGVMEAGGMEMGGVEMDEGRKKQDEDGPAQLERQDPKSPGDVPHPAMARRRMPWQAPRVAGTTAKGNAEMGGRMCMYCMKHQGRTIWIANEPTALNDHARTHCVETLMCPSKDCTYMNTHRSRISQHVSYVHKKWGQPIDLCEVYPPMLKSLMIRLRQCFPDMPGICVCQLCRVATRPVPEELRWHAQSHLPTAVFECSRNICTGKFATEQECREHIAQANCRGSVINGLTDAMEAEVTALVERCFTKKVYDQCHPAKPQVIILDEELYAEDHSSTPSASTSKPTSQQREKEKKMEVEEEMMEEEKVDEMEKAGTSQ